MPDTDHIPLEIKLSDVYCILQIPRLLRSEQTTFHRVPQFIHPHPYRTYLVKEDLPSTWFYE